MGTEQHEPLLPSPKVLSWPGCQPSANQGPFFADVSSDLKKGGGCSQSHPTPEVWSPGPPRWGLQAAPGSFVCSVTRPELPGPLSCWPGSCLLLTQWPPLAPQLQAPRPGAAAHSLSCLQSPAILPPMVSRVGLLGGFVLGGRGVKYLCGFVFSAATVSDARRGLSAPGGRCRGPTGCSLYFLRSNWPPPPGRGFSRCLCEGSVGGPEEGVQPEPPGVGGEFPSPRALMGKTGWLKITRWVKRPGGQRVAHGTCQAWLSAELVHTGQLHFVDKHGPRCRVGVGRGGGPVCSP